MSFSKKRIALLDEIRGFLVLCMIFYHAFIFMYEQAGISFGYKTYTFFLPVQPFFSSMFILVAGISSKLSSSNLKRGIKIFFVAMALNFVSIVILPKLGFVNTSIYFGILNFFSISFIIYGLTEKFLDKIPPLIGCLISAFLIWIFRSWLSLGIISLWKNVYYAVPASVYEIKWLFPFGIQSPDFFSADYFPLVPFFFVYLLGTYLGVWVQRGNLPSFAYPVHSKTLSWLGKNCLLVFFIHLPIIFVLVEFYLWVVSKI